HTLRLPHSPIMLLMHFISPSMHFTPHVSSLLFPGQALQQSPDTVVRVGDSVTLTCSEKENAFASMYWYKLPMGKDATLQLVVYSVEGGMAEIEKEFRNHFQSNGTKSNHLSVEIDHALLNDSGTYFCANQDPQ
uniref:Ig-like domain-containing protein n=1 Tax=Bubo bubo TaxID=30461 RepID=A0A8C0ETR7_BUBBB